MGYIDLFVYPPHLADQGRPGPARTYFGRPGTADSLPKLRLFDKSDDGFRQCVHISRREQQAGPLVLEDLDRASHTGRHDGQTV